MLEDLVYVLEGVVGGFGIYAGRFDNSGGSGMYGGGSVSAEFCGLGGAWFCAWYIGTTTIVVLMEDFALKDFSLEELFVKHIFPLLGQFL